MSRVKGSIVTVGDTASQAAYGKQSLGGQTGLQITADAEVVDRANWKLSHYKNAVSRVRRLPLSSAVTPALVQQLARQLRDRVTIVEHGPGTTATTFSQDFLIEFIHKRVSPGLYETEWSLSAGDTGGYWQLGVAGASELGNTTRLAY